jgi:diguanylate cyclase (GGDEF)-like protein
VSTTAPIIRRKVARALRAAARKNLGPGADVDAFIDAELPFSVWGSYGSNTCCVQVDGGGESTVVVDCGSGLRDLGNAILTTRGPSGGRYDFLMTHLHWDHLMGFPFFTPAYVPGNVIRFHGCHEAMERALRTQQSPPFFPVGFDDLGADIAFNTLIPGQTTEIGGMAVTPFAQNHPSARTAIASRPAANASSCHRTASTARTRKSPGYPFLEHIAAPTCSSSTRSTPSTPPARASATGATPRNIVGSWNLAKRAGVRTLCLFHQGPPWTTHPSRPSTTKPAATPGCSMPETPLGRAHGLRRHDHRALSPATRKPGPAGQGAAMHQAETRPAETDLGETLLILNFASRMLTAASDRDMVTDMALETLADFAAAPRVALWTLAPDGATLTWTASSPPTPPPARSWPCPWRAAPSSASSPKARHGLPARPGVWPRCPRARAGLPRAAVVASSGLILGALSLDAAAPAPETLASLRLLATVLAVSLDNARLFELAMVDGLTGLYMRRFYDARIAEELAALRPGASACLVVFDIDHFKRVNDTWGHATGDLVLREFARTVRHGVRRGHDLACRYGGEEFTLIMPATTAPQALEIVEGVRHAAAAMTFPGIEPPLRVTVSAGIAQADGPGQTAENIFARADAALYAAKEGGRDRAVVAK